MQRGNAFIDTIYIYAADMVAKDIMFHKMYEITFMKDEPRQNCIPK